MAGMFKDYGDFNVAYDVFDGTRLYQAANSDRETAEKSLVRFKERYLNPDGSPKPFPNGKGFYDCTNPRVINVRGL